MCNTVLEIYVVLLFKMAETLLFHICMFLLGKYIQHKTVFLLLVRFVSIIPMYVRIYNIECLDKICYVL